MIEFWSVSAAVLYINAGQAVHRQQDHEVDLLNAK